ncbi:hypothetical protein WA158_004647 [Blastocystis sp. Blastoise]
MSVLTEVNPAFIQQPTETITENQTISNEVNPSPIDMNDSCGANCITIFDWDDTLMPSTWLSDHVSEEKCFSTEVKHQLQNVEDYVYLVLSQALQLGVVVIVTNSEEGWVEYCCDHFFFRLRSLMSSINIVSARTKYQDIVPLPHLWKQQAFQDIIGDYKSFLPYNASFSIISIGDSTHERNALNNMKSLFHIHGYLKSIKFIDNPSLFQLRRELDYVYTTFRSIIEKPSDLDILLFM